MSCEDDIFSEGPSSRRAKIRASKLLQMEKIPRGQVVGRRQPPTSEAHFKDSSKQTVANGETPVRSDGWKHLRRAAQANFKIRSNGLLKTRKTPHDQALAMEQTGRDLCLDDDRPQMLDARACPQAASEFRTA